MGLLGLPRISTTMGACSYVTMINQLTLCDNIVDTAPYLKLV